ncbi:MAG: hypothetical protein CVU54_14495 [Deltaproteobacteria bacterium HGW-Deltaproteobacteria-12]|jgi:hypothetical protein|nr:MAG: hypothetical protein CVU54_14495 [Deltaproteobacteria bacterium HGW-Deltaproteobacteria-12]
MVQFIPVRYAHTKYPDDVKPKIQETTANFFNFFEHKKSIQKTALPYLSLHTDPGYPGKKEMFLSSDVLDQFPVISKNVFDFGSRCVSKLWFNEKWSKEFSGFLVGLTEGIERQRIKVIEVHPPIDAYCDSLETFLKIYAAFEEEALKEFPSAIINIENRCNPDPKRKGGKFLLSRNNDIIKLSNLISRSDLKLKLVIDIPQLLSEHHGNNLLSEKQIKDVLLPIRDIRESISGTHIWGYNINKENGGQHGADFNTYFNNDPKLKDCFLQEIYKLFDDGKARYYVPEVSSTVAVQSIVNDLRSAGIQFVDPE